VAQGATPEPATTQVSDSTANTTAEELKKKQEDETPISEAPAGLPIA